MALICSCDIQQLCNAACIVSYKTKSYRFLLNIARADDTLWLDFEISVSVRMVACMIKQTMFSMVEIRSTPKG